MIQKIFKTTLSYLLFCATFQIHLTADEQSATPVMAKDGVHLFHGPRGHHGHKGYHGKRGKKGKNGTDGALGATGLTANSECFIPAIGNVAGPAGISGSTVTFATTLFLTNGGISFSGGTTFTVTAAGDYLISYGVNATIDGGFQILTLFINGVAATPNSNVSIQNLTGGLLAVLFAFDRIYTLAAGDTVEVRRTTVGITPTDGNFLIMKVSS